MKRNVALIILLVAVGLNFVYSLGRYSAEAQEPTPGLTIGEPNCAATPLLLNAAATGLAGGVVMYIDPSKTVRNPTDSNIRFIPSNSFSSELVLHTRVTLDLYSFLDLNDDITPGATSVKLMEYCQLGEDDLILRYYSFDGDDGNKLLVKFP